MQESKVSLFKPSKDVIASANSNINLITLSYFSILLLFLYKGRSFDNVTSLSEAATTAATTAVEETTIVSQTGSTSTILSVLTRLPFIVITSLLFRHLARKQDERKKLKSTLEAFITNSVHDHQQQQGQESVHTIVLVHGWPDSVHLWDQTVKHFTENAKRRYKVINISLPNYEITIPSHEKPSFGYEFDEAVSLLRNTIVAQVPDGNCTIIAHDWGTIITTMMLAQAQGKESESTNSTKICKNFISLDIGFRENLGPRFGIAVVTYQLCLNFAYTLGSYFGGDQVNQFTAWYQGWPGYDNQPLVDANMTWPYRMLWKDLVFNGGRYYKKNFAKFVPSKDISFMFIYGKDKPAGFNFFDENWLNKMKQAGPKNRVVGVPGHHWFAAQDPKTYLVEVDAFLESVL